MHLRGRLSIEKLFSLLIEAQKWNRRIARARARRNSQKQRREKKRATEMPAARFQEMIVD
jgi:hypothetical protein